MFMLTQQSRTLECRDESEAAAESYAPLEFSRTAGGETGVKLTEEKEAKRDRNTWLAFCLRDHAS